MFGCSPLFIGMAAPLTETQVRESFRKKEEQKAKWGPRKRVFREGRRKRQEEWKRAEE
jgi:Mitochondrial ribosomal protein subunit L20